MKLTELEKIVRPQFIYAENPVKPLETNIKFETTSSAARIIFVGLADMYGHDSSDICDHLDMGYQSYLTKLGQFKAMYKEATKLKEQGLLASGDESLVRFYTKLNLCLNAIKFSKRSNPYFKIQEWINHE